jgi:hypothetical protein
MLRFGKNGGLGRWFVLSAAAFAAPFLGSFPSTARALSTVISSGNSTIDLNPTTGAAPLISAWTVDGTNEYGGTPAGGEEFYYSIGNAAPTPINSLTLSGTVFASGGLFTATYDTPASGPALTITIKDTLAGGSTGSGSSALGEVITVDNNSGSAVTFHLYEYTDLNLNATPSDDTLSLSLPNTANQSDPLGTTASVNAVGNPNEYQIANNSAILTELTGSSAVTLSNNSTGPITGNDNFAFEWDQAMAATGSTSSLQVSLNETIAGGSVTPAVPLPSAAWTSLAALAGLGTIGIIRSRRKAAHLA